MNNPSTLSVEQREELILNHRTCAKKLSAYFLKRWGSYIEQDELESLSDIALCEAALRYRTDKGAQFQTLLFFYVKNIIIREIKSRKSTDSMYFLECQTESSKVNETIEKELAADSDVASLDDQLIAKELKVSCKNALDNLLPFERKVVLEVCVFEKKVAKVARQLGYSRGHVSETRTKAVNKMRSYFTAYREAA